MSETQTLNEAQTCELYELSDRGQAHTNVFVVGCFRAKFEHVAVASQQIRAINLVHSLVKERLKKGGKICVIGGGAAGLTAAAYAIDQGLAVTVLESRAPLWNLRGCRTRWLHPNLFRRWPDPDWDCTATNLPVMNWYASYACDVGNLLWSKFLTLNSRQSKVAPHRYADLYIARNITITPELKLAWTNISDGNLITERYTDTYDAVIIALGFGTEQRVRDAEGSVYWLDDTLERERPDHSIVRYLISGTGDGGLTDLLRIRIKDFRHHHLRESLLELKTWQKKISEEYESILQQERANKNFNSTKALQNLADKYRPNTLLKHRRPNTSVVLTNREERALSSPAWRISRFLAAALLNDDPDTSYRSGGRWSASCDDRTPQAHPRCFRATFKDGGTLDFDAVVVRHGPPQRFAESTLEDLGFGARVIEAASNKWHAEVRRGTETDVLIAPLSNRDHALRSRKPVVMPALTGRTNIAMLSRLVASVAPEDYVDTPRRIAAITHPLVSDETANALAPIGESLAFARGESSGLDGWQRGPEVSRNDAVEIIVGADASLKSLLKTYDVTQLERLWVLPRPKWVAPGPLLKNTCVARHWAHWRLKYERRSSIKVKRQILELPDKSETVREACIKDEILSIVDFPTLRLRVAYCRRGGRLPRRLARELGAQFLYISMQSDGPNRGLVSVVA